MAAPETQPEVILADVISDELASNLRSQISEVNKTYLNEGQMAAIIATGRNEERVLSQFDIVVEDAAAKEISNDGELVPHLNRISEFTRDLDRIQRAATIAWNNLDTWIISSQWALATVTIAATIFLLEIYLEDLGLWSVVAGVAIFAAAGYYVDSTSRTRAQSESKTSRRHVLHLASILFIVSAIGLFAGFLRWDELSTGAVEFRHVDLHDVIWPLQIGSIAVSAAIIAVFYWLHRWNIGRLAGEEVLADGNLIDASQTIVPKMKSCDDDIKARLGILLVAEIQLEMARLNIPQSDNWALTVPVYSNDLVWSHLSEHYSAYVEIPELIELTDDVARLQRAAIGIAGERGSGKTALMNALRRSANLNKSLTVWISAPTAYDEREFLLSVLARLAVRAGIKLTGNSMWPSTPPEKELKDGNRFRALLWGALLAIGAVVVGISVSNIDGNIKGLIAGAAATVGAALLLTRALAPKHLFNDYPERTRKYLRATHSVLNDLWFEHKQSNSSSVSMGGLGLALGGAMTEERTRRPFTVPQLVQLWDDYVRYLTTGSVPVDEEPTGTQGEDGYFPRIVIFIDEVDKIKDEGGPEGSKDRIGEFIRILKALYKPSNLFFFVSISEDAHDRYRLHSVGRAGRDEFDSAFDKMKKLELMSYEDTRRLLNGRIADVSGLPEPVIQLIWILSKGNPRESIRLAREILQDFQGVRLHEVTTQLLTRHHLDDLRDQYKRILKKVLTPEELFEGIRTVDSVESMLLEPLGKADEVLAPLNEQIALHPSSHGLNGNEDENAHLDLSHLRASLYYALTISHTFRDSRRGAFFEQLKTNNVLVKLEAARILQEKDGLPDQALISIDDFRKDSGLKVVSTNSVKKTKSQNTKDRIRTYIEIREVPGDSTGHN